MARVAQHFRVVTVCTPGQHSTVRWSRKGIVNGAVRLVVDGERRWLWGRLERGSTVRRDERWRAALLQS